MTALTLWPRRSLPFACLALLLLLGLALWFTRLRDLDFWWHISTGQYILEQKALPDKDPFTFTFIADDKDMPERPAAILKSYWISQIIFFLIYSSAGPLGIILLKAAVFGLILFLLWKFLLDNGASSLLMFILLAGFVIASRQYAAERPQIFSFLFASMAFRLLERERMNRSPEKRGLYTTRFPALYFLPLLMLLWANMHGGYLVGMVFILVYAAGLCSKDAAGVRFRTLALYVISLAATFLNPVTYHQITSFFSFQGSLLQKETAEFAPLFSMIRAGDMAWYPFLALIAVSVVAIAASLLRPLFSLDRDIARDKRTSSLAPEHLMLLGGTLLASFVSVRYGMFFMIVAVPVVALFLTKGVPFSPSEGVKKGGLAVAAALLLFFFLKSPLLDEWKGPLIDQSVIPVNATEFLRQRTPEPRLYNDINWGGYLAWSLYPGYRVFSDTRTLNLEIYRQYLSILNANERTLAGALEWKALLDAYSVRTIIHAAVNPYSGEVYPLMQKLLKDERWHLVYFDGVAAILTRSLSPGLAAIPKELLVEEMRLESLRGLERTPNHPGFLKTLAMLNALR